MLDFWNKPTSELKAKNLWLFDLDGTIYNEDVLFDGALDLIGSINQKGGKFVFITNNSSKSVAEYIKKVNSMGISANSDSFFTSTQASSVYIKKHYPNAKVYCQGTKSMVNELQSLGINVVEHVTSVDVVLVGFDLELSSQKLRNTCEILCTQPVDFIATNPDLACPVSFGFVPDCGSICEMIRNATGKKPKYIGKPEPTMVHLLCEKFNTPISETVVVGDRLYTDIAIGLNAGITSVCVLTGETSDTDILNSKIKPSLTFKSVKDIYRAIY